MSPHEDTDRLAAASPAAGDPTGWEEIAAAADPLVVRWRAACTR
jgi:hypothetical protein